MVCVRPHASLIKPSSWLKACKSSRALSALSASRHRAHTYTDTLNMALSLAFYAISSRDVASDTAMAPQDCQRYRTRSDIVWSCLSTIFLCTWVSLHPDIPKPINMSGFRPSQRIRAHIWRFIRFRLMWVVLAVFAPEMILGRSLMKFFSARDLVKKHGTPVRFI